MQMLTYDAVSETNFRDIFKTIIFRHLCWQCTGWKAVKIRFSQGHPRNALFHARKQSHISLSNTKNLPEDLPAILQGVWIERELLLIMPHGLSIVISIQLISLPIFPPLFAIYISSGTISSLFKNWEAYLPLKKIIQVIVISRFTY